MVNVSAQQMKEKIESGENIFVIDVRTPMELSRGRIEESMNIPLDIFEEEIEKKIPDKNSEVYLYCLSGSRSNIAAQIMENLGYKNVYSLISGLLSWRSNNFPLV